MSRELECRTCHAGLELGQRYCVKCGARARPVPRWVAPMLGLMPEWSPPGGKALAIKKALFGKEGKALAGPVQMVKIGPLQIPWAMPTPRAAAIAVLSVLWFGVGIGAAGLTVAASPINTVIYRGANGVVTTAPVITPTGGSGGSGGGTPVSSPGGGGGGTPAGTSPSQTGTQTQTTGSTSTNTTTTGTTTTVGPTYPTNPTLPPIHNVWVISLGNVGYSQSFEYPSGDSYLHQVSLKGALVPGYYAVAGSELANEIAMVSGQGPTQQTAKDCPKYTAAAGLPGSAETLDQFLGGGCVYPDAVPSLTSELTAAHFTWKAYIQGLGAASSTKSSVKLRRTTARVARSPFAGVQLGLTARLTTGPSEGNWAAQLLNKTRRKAHRAPKLTASEKALTCRYPKLGATDPFHSATKKSNYVTWRNPFVYFDSVTTSTTCDKDDVGTDQLTTDLKTNTSTPNVSFIYPDPCDDGSATACRKGAPSGSAPLNKFLKPILKQITSSAAYKAGGLILITSTMAPQSGADADSSSCCGTPSYPNLPPSTTTTTTTTTPTTTTGTITTPTTTTGTTTAPLTTTTGTTTTVTTTTGTTTVPAGTTTTTTTTTTPTLPPGVTATGGGGKVGMIALSNWITPATIDGTDTFSHFSLLASIEQLFGLPASGYSAIPSVPTFGAGLYTGFL